VNVDITRTRTVYEDVTGLLRACPILVSLHLPTEKNKLENEPPMDESSGSYAPSEWVVFEEAFMDALNRRVFRLRHKDVRPPAFALGWREFVFDQSNFNNKLDGLIKAIETHKASPEYLEAIRGSEEWAKRVSPSQLRRNLEGEYPPYPTK